MQGQSPPAATRGLTKKGADDDQEEADEEETDGGAGDIMDLLPRTDIRSVQMHGGFKLPHGTYFRSALDITDRLCTCREPVLWVAVIKSHRTWWLR